MSAPIGPGDQVRCINASPHGTTGDTWLVLGRVYRVAGMAFLELLIDGDRGDRTWSPTRFEHLSARSFEHILTSSQPAPEREFQDA